MNASQGRLSKSIEIIVMNAETNTQEHILKNEMSGTGGLDSNPSRILLKANVYGDSLASIHA
jgi:hypothetical protein